MAKPRRRVRIVAQFEHVVLAFRRDDVFAVGIPQAMRLDGYVDARLHGG